MDRRDRLTGRSILITGSTGIAEAAALRCSAEGAAVFVVSRTPDNARALAERVTRAGGQAGWAAADLTQEVETDAAVSAAVERFGRIDGLFSVAGGSGRRFGDGPIHELTMDGWDRTLELNLRSQALMARAATRIMLAQSPTSVGSRGSIVLVSSVLASSPVPELFATHAYAAAKGAIVSLATTHGRHLRRRWDPGQYHRPAPDRHADVRPRGDGSDHLRVRPAQAAPRAAS